jgi:hypothetical protein
MKNRQKIIQDLREIIGKNKNTLISGEVGVGKITNTLEALRDRDNVYYIGNPVDYVGKPRPKGYNKYIGHITSLKKDMQIITNEKEILSFDFSSLSEKGGILLIDEIYGRSIEQYQKILSLLDREYLKIILIAGCLKNVGRIIGKFDMILMIIHDGVLILDKEFVLKISTLLGSDPLAGQTGLFG